MATPYAKYHLTPELEAEVSAMTPNDRCDWFYNRLHEHLATLSVEALFPLADDTKEEHRHRAREYIMVHMCQAGLLRDETKIDPTCIAPCCGQPFTWRQVRGALGHIKHSPCPSGFSIIDGKCVCDCKKKCDTPQLAMEHQRKIGNCLQVRISRQALFCVLCEHQCESKKDLEDHKQTKSHIKKENPIKLICDACEVSCRTKKEYERHCEGKMHKFRTDPATRPNLTCSACKITCTSQRKYEAHLLTAKHLKKTTSVNVAVDTNGPD